jgi:t-SNARE complex subunit (syntaxin)
LEADISDVNQIFQDLAKIVHEQGDMVDSIEANIEHANIHVHQGHTNVQQALQYQNQARKKKILLFIFLCALVFIIGLTLYLWAR